MKKIFFKKRMPEPELMNKIENEAFEFIAKKNYKVWFQPLVFDVKLLLKKNIPKKIIDVGCGPGFLLKEVANNFKSSRVIGLDLSSQMLGIAAKNCAKLKNVRLKKGSAYSLPYPDNFFDLVLSKDSLHQFSKPKIAIREMMRVLKPSGLLYLQDLKRELPFKILKTAIPPNTPIKKIQYFSARAAYTIEEAKKIFKSIIGNSKLMVKTRKIDEVQLKFYNYRAIPLKDVRRSFAVRYVATVIK